MKHWMFGGIGLGVGLVVGGATVYFYQKRQLDSALMEQEGIEKARVDALYDCYKLEQRAEDEKFKVEQLLEAVKIFADEDTRYNILELVNTRMTVRRMQAEGFDEETITDAMIRRRYDDILEQYQSTEFSAISEEPPKSVPVMADKVDEEEETDEDDVAIEEVQAGDRIWQMSEDDYVRTDMDRQVLYYYVGDDTLADEDDDTVDEVVVGDIADKLEQYFKPESPDDEAPPAIFVCNERLQICYEILPMDGSYVDAIGG